MLIVAYILIGTICLFIIRNNYKNIKGISDKLIFFLVLVIYYLPVVLYFIDYYDLGKILLGDANNSRWFDFISSYLGIIIGTIISGGILFLINKIQMMKQQEDNFESRRIQIVPLLKYRLVKKVDKLNWKYAEKYDMFSEDCSPFYLILNIENMGLGAAKHIFITGELDGQLKSKGVQLGNLQSILKRNQNKDYIFRIYYDLSSRLYTIHQLKLNIYYKDLMDNWYKQELVIMINRLSTSNGKLTNNIFIKEIKDEQYMKVKRSS